MAAFTRLLAFLHVVVDNHKKVIFKEHDYSIRIFFTTRNRLSCTKAFTKYFISLQVDCSRMGKTAGTLEVYILLTRPVIDFMEFVCLYYDRIVVILYC